jgi:DNA (cytosine-5)-methyltransferase 1
VGAKCVYSNEWDASVQQVYAENFGDMPEGDITLVDENTIPDHDILCAGFPCQAFSISGKQRGFEDSRGTLFFDVARIVKAKNPKVVFMENVKNFATHDNGKTLEVVKGTMEELGYTFYQKVLIMECPKSVRESIWCVFAMTWGSMTLNFQSLLH